VAHRHGLTRKKERSEIIGPGCGRRMSIKKGNFDGAVFDRTSLPARQVKIKRGLATGLKGKGEGKNRIDQRHLDSYPE